MKTVFLRVLGAENKAGALLTAISNSEAARGNYRFDVDATTFGSVPRSPFAYWVSKRFRAVFERHPRFQGTYFAVRGAYTTNDFKYYRLAWEVSPQRVARNRRQTCEGRPFVALAKGGAFSPYYADVHLVVCWANDGAEAKVFLSAYREHKGWGTDWSACLNGYSHYFRPGLTWPLRTNGLSLRVMPKGCIFTHKGPAAFVEGDDPRAQLALAAITNSAPFAALVSLQLARTELAQSYEVGLIQRTPAPELTTREQDALAALARRAWSLKRSLDTRDETSRAFTLPALLQASEVRFQVRDTVDASLAECAAKWAGHVATIDVEIDSIQAEINRRCFAIYGIDAEDRQAIEKGLGDSDADEAAGYRGDKDEIIEGDAGPMVESLLGWAAGAAYGRFDVRLATRERRIPDEPEPFDALPVCPPGMLTCDDGLPLADPPAGYPITFPPDGLLVNDPGHDRDLPASVRRVFELIFDDPDIRWREAAELMTSRGRGLRDWFSREFFASHLKRYSKSRRKAPIYWQLATASASYSVWLYCHSFSRDTFFKILNDYANPKLQHEERKLTSLTQAAGPNPAANQRNEIASQDAFIEELRAFREEVARVAPLWKPDLDDGVIINFAPLWRLVPHHKAWQKECKKVWDKLVKGDYDWAHLAMHLWPGRVVPKCAGDRSLAIAHDLEDEFWYEGGDGKWCQRDVDDSRIKTIVEERTSPAVKAALEDLLSAPAPVTTNAKRGRKRSSSKKAKA